MNRGFLLAVLFVIIIQGVFAVCGEGQININTAPLEELDKLEGIGPVKAQAIIDARPFDNVDDLIRVNGIGNITLEKIKSQGLACVDGEVEEDPEETEEEVNGDSNSNEEGSLDDNKTEVSLNNEFEEESTNKENLIYEKISQKPETIKLNAKDLKTDNDSENLQRNFFWYGVIGFLILLGLLFIIKKRKNKNEFR